jgi:hypothetical protein
MPPDGAFTVRSCVVEVRKRYRVITACTLRASDICWIYSPNKDSQFDAHFAIAR